MILVTGATGFLGSKLTEVLVAQGNRIIATKRKSSSIPKSLANSPLITWIEADVRDYFSLAELFPQIREVYHCAALVSYHPDDVSEMMDINVEGTKNIVNLCLRYKSRLLHVSSIASLGSKKDQLITEKEKWEFTNRESAYSISKYKSEMEVWRGIEEGMDGIIVNPSVIMGSGCGNKGSGQIFSLVDKGLIIYPPGAIGIIDVEDTARLMVWLMDSGIKSERFILNGENISNRDLLIKISKLLDKRQPKIPANRFLLGLAWRFTSLLSFFTKKRLPLTKDAARASQNHFKYSNAKIKALSQFEFKSIDHILQEITKEFKSTQT